MPVKVKSQSNTYEVPYLQGNHYYTCTNIDGNSILKGILMSQVSNFIMISRHQDMANLYDKTTISQDIRFFVSYHYFISYPYSSPSMPWRGSVSRYQSDV